jgi:hypothetical protein
MTFHPEGQTDDPWNIDRVSSGELAYPSDLTELRRLVSEFLSDGRYAQVKYAFYDEERGGESKR